MWLSPVQVVVLPVSPSDGLVAVNLRNGRKLEPVAVPCFLANAAAVAEARRLDLWP